MRDETRTRDELVAELDELRRRVEELESRLGHASKTSGHSGTESDMLRNEIEKMSRIKQQLGDTERLYRTLVETAKDVIWTVDLNLRYTYVSPSVTKVLGYTVQEIMDLRPLDGLTPDSRERVIRAFQEEMALEASGPREKYTSRTEEIERYHKDGSTRWEEITTTFLRDGNGKPIGILGVSHDITDRKRMEGELSEARDEFEKRVEERTGELLRANTRLQEEIRERKQVEEALRESEQRQELALHGADLGLWDWFVRTGRTVVSRRSAEIIGYELEEIEQRFEFWEGLLHPEDKNRAVQAVYDHLEGRTEYYEDEYRARAKSGEWKWVFSRGKVVERDPDGNPLRMAGTYRDITFRKHVEEALRLSEERFRTVADFTYDWEYWIDLDGNFLYVSPSCERVTGYSAKEFEDDPGLFERIVHPDDLDLVTAHWQEARKTEPAKTYCFDFRIIHSTGEVRWINHACQPVHGEGGRPLGRRACNRDVTDRKLAEYTLAEKEGRYRALFENMRNGVVIYAAENDGDDFVIIDFNAAAEAITARQKEEVIGKRILEVFPSVKEQGFLDLLATTWRTGLPMHLPVTRHQDNRVDVWVENFVYKLPSGDIVAVITDETERKRAEDALRASEAKYRLLIENAPVGILSIHRDGSIANVNSKLLQIMGSPSADETKAINMLEFPPLRDAGITEVFLRSMSDATVQMSELPYTSKWGKTSYLRMIVTPLFDETGEVNGCQAIVEDVTHRKTAEDELRESRWMLESILAAVPVGIALHRERQVQWANEAWAKMFGFSGRQDCVGQDTREIYPSDAEYELAREALYEGPADGGVREIDAQLRRNDGSLFDTLIRTRALDPSDPGKGVIGAIADVSERRRAEEALRESEEKYRATFNNAAVGIDLVDNLGRFLEVNDTLQAFLGYTQPELRNLTILDVTYPGDVARSAQSHEELMRGEIRKYRLEKRYLRKDGSVVWADTSVSAIRDNAGQHRATVGVIVDITQRRRSDQIRNRLATAVEQASETIEITDTEGTIIYVNPAFERTTGYSRKEAMGNNPRMLKSGQHDDRFYKRMWDTITAGNVWTGHLVNRKKDGTLFEEEVTISPIKDKTEQIVNYVAVKRDVTKEIALQTQLLHAQKMEAIGTLAGGIAHDFNNLLQVTLGYSELLLQEKEPGDQEYADLQKIFQAARSGAELVQRMLTFSRKVEPKPVPLNLNRQITQVEKLLRRTIPKMIDIRMDLSDDLTKINADPAQMEQVLMNLAVNARDAISESGKLTLATRNVALDEEYCRVHVGVSPGEYVMLQVSDTGHGMNRETIEHIFEPFYTTKELGRGTGLGLAIVYGIVKQHGGHITCESEVGKGTNFSVYLPAIEPQLEPEVERNGEFPAFGTETILLVDDEEFVRDLGERILCKGGYTVLTAADGRDACLLYRQKRGKIALVILDLIMPEMGGQECLRELLKIDPEVKVLIASGYPAGTSAGETIESGAKGFVDKPFRVKEFLRLVRKVLDAR
jgi:two-component system, cell cycle sensor histidine kinase and response regulator CckA